MEENKKIHPVDIPGYEGDEGMRRLARCMVDLRFDRAAFLYENIDREILDAAERDEQLRGRRVIAQMLRNVAGQVRSVREGFIHLFRTFEKNMKEELSE
jgi:hypothetical protein